MLYDHDRKIGFLKVTKYHVCYSPEALAEGRAKLKLMKTVTSQKLKFIKINYISDTGVSDYFLFLKKYYKV